MNNEKMTTTLTIYSKFRVWFNLSLIVVGLTLPQLVFAQSSHEYAELTRERVEDALKPNATKADLSLAEGSLTALGWFVVYGNDQASSDQAKKLNDIPFGIYNGTDKMQWLYMDFTSTAYGEMLNLNRFDSTKPTAPSTELIDSSKDYVERTIEEGTSNGDDMLIRTEARLMALGWLCAYGDSNSALSDKLEGIAMKLTSNVYEVHSVGYDYMRNFHAWEMDK